MKPEPSGWFSKYSLPNNLTTLCQSTNSYVENQSILFTNAILLSLLHFYKGKQRAMTANMTSCPVLYDTLSITIQNLDTMERRKKYPDYCLRRLFAPDNSPDEWYNQPHPAFLLIYYRGTSLLIYKARHYLCIKLALTYVQALTQLRYKRQPIPRSLGTGGRERDYSLLSLTVKWRISGASHSMATPRVTCSRRS